MHLSEFIYDKFGYVIALLLTVYLNKNIEHISRRSFKETAFKTICEWQLSI